MIQAREKGKVLNYTPELTASEYAAKLRVRQLSESGYEVRMLAYEVKTQGTNFDSIAQPGKTFKME